MDSSSAYSGRARRIALAFLITFALGAGVVWFGALRRSPAAKILPPENPAAEVASPAPVSISAPTNSFRPASPANFASFQQRPLAVAQESRSHQWTAENGRDTNVIRQLAHNELEYQRMVGESARIERRQLVYRKDTAAAVVERARLTGQPVRQLTLPAFDGEELVFAIARADLNPSGQQGTFTGTLAGRPDAMVTLAFKGGREAFTVLSATDKLYLVGEPRQPGEVIVKQIDPETYVPGGCGTP